MRERIILGGIAAAIALATILSISAAGGDKLLQHRNAVDKISEKIETVESLIAEVGSREIAAGDIRKARASLQDALQRLEWARIALKESLQPYHSLQPHNP